MWIRIRIRNTDSDDETDLTFGEEGSRKSFAGNAEKTRRETYEYEYNDSFSQLLILHGLIFFFFWHMIAFYCNAAAPYFNGSTKAAKP
jgi:hypothetical protein